VLTLAFHACSASDLVVLAQGATTSAASGGELTLGVLTLMAVVAALVMTSTIGGLLATAVAAVSALLTVLARAAGVSLLALVLIGVVLYAVLHH